MGGKIDGPGSTYQPAPPSIEGTTPGGQVDPSALPPQHPGSKSATTPGMAPVGAPVK